LTPLELLPAYDARQLHKPSLPPAFRAKPSFVGCPLASAFSAVNQRQRRRLDADPKYGHYLPDTLAATAQLAGDCSRLSSG
jgi:hypothetical protein